MGRGLDPATEWLLDWIQVTCRSVECPLEADKSPEMAKKVRALPQIPTLPQVVDLPVWEERNLKKIFIRGIRIGGIFERFGIVWIEACEFLPFGCGMIVKLRGVKKIIIGAVKLGANKAPC